MTDELEFYATPGPMTGLADVASWVDVDCRGPNAHDGLTVPDEVFSFVLGTLTPVVESRTAFG